MTGIFQPGGCPLVAMPCFHSMPAAPSPCWPWPAGEALKGDALGSTDPLVGSSQVGGSASIQSVSSWGLDRIDQVDLPLNGYYSSGDLDGRGVHGERLHDEVDVVPPASSVRGRQGKDVRHRVC